SQPVANIKGTRFLPRSASWDEEMEKRSRRRIRDLVAHPASQGLDANENRWARISMMARSANAPLKGRIQKRKTKNLQIITSGLQRTAGPTDGARRADIVTVQQQIYLNTSTVANGSADHGRKRFKVNFVFWPGWTSTSR